MAAITERPGGLSRLCCGGPLLLLCLVRLCRHTFVLSSCCVCRHTPATVWPIMYVSRVSRYRHAQVRTFARPSDRCQPCVKGCRTAARVEFCEGPRTCAHGSTTPMHLEGCPHNERRMSPVFRTHPDLRRRRIDFCCVMQIFCRTFRARIFPEIRRGDTFVVMEKRGFQIHRRDYSYRTWKALYTLDLLYNHLNHH